MRLQAALGIGARGQLEPSSHHLISKVHEGRRWLQAFIACMDGRPWAKDLAVKIGSRMMSSS